MVKEAKKRGLPNLQTTPEALAVLKEEKNIKVFENQGVLTRKELQSRYDVYTWTYETVLNYESILMVDMAKTLFVPACLGYVGKLGDVAKVAGARAKAIKSLQKEVADGVEEALESTDKLEAAIKGGATVKIKDTMEALREAIDHLEGIVPKEDWPLPTYAEMLFIY